MFGVDVGFHDSWFFIALLIIFSVVGLAGLEKEAVDPKTKLFMDIKGKPCAAEGPGASMRI